MKYFLWFVACTWTGIIPLVLMVFVWILKDFGIKVFDTSPDIQFRIAGTTVTTLSMMLIVWAVTSAILYFRGG